MATARRPLVLALLLVALALPGAGAAAGPAEEAGPAYLVYAGPYSASPSSAFGHLFLVLARHPGDPSPLWDVVTFSAVTFDADPVRYLTIGIAGGFLGRFSRLPFHEKSREYELLEDRDLWLVELRLTPSQRAALEGALEERRGRWYPYSFFRQNCAFHLQALLAAATGAVSAPSGLVSPTGVVTEVLRGPLAGPSFFRPAASRRIAAAAAALSPDVLRRLRREPWTALAADTAWLDGLDLPARRVAQAYFGLRALEATALLPAPTRAGLAHLRVLDADAAPDPAAPRAPGGPGAELAPPVFHRYPRLALSREAGASGPGRLALRIRGALHDEADPWLGHQPLNTMELLSAQVSSREDRPALRLDAAVLFSQRSLAPSDWIRRRGSWLLEVVGRRGGLYDDHAGHLEARGGLGATLRLPGDLYAAGLGTVAGVGAWDRGATVAPGVEAGLVGLTFAWWRWGLRYTREHDLLSWSRWHERARAWIRVDVGRRLGLTVAAERWRGEDRVSIAVEAYP
jgi:hypothetical protein